MPRPKQPPVIDEKLAEVWLKGGVSPVVLEGLEHNIALTLRHRLYRERTKMRVAEHVGVGSANNATISIQPDPKAPGAWRLIVYPANLLIEAALEKAGITSGDPPPLD